MGIRESSVLGVIPEGWEVEPLSCHARFWKGLGITKADLVEEGARVISYGQIHSKGNTGIHTGDELFRRVPWSVANAGLSAKLEVGDIVFADTSEDVEGLGNEAYIDDAKDAFAGYDAIICRPESSKLFGKYLAYLAQTDCWRSQIRAFTTGVKVFHLTQSQLKSAWVLLPPVDEQAKICRCLDAEVSKIQTSIAVINEQASILERYKSSLIHEAVTKGLDRDVPMRPSGVEWIGDIPYTWECLKCKYVASKIGVGVVINPSTYFDENGTVPFLRGLNVTRGRIKAEKMVFISEDSNRKLSNTMVRAGDIVIERVGEPGVACVVPPEYDRANTASILNLRVNADCDSRFVCYVINSDVGRCQFNVGKYGSAMQQTSVMALSNLLLVKPPLSEQREIADFLDEKCSRIDCILDLKRRQVDVLKRRRQSLIYEYVTGKRRVGQEA